MPASVPAAPWIVPALLIVLALVVSALFKVRSPQTTQDAFVSLRLPSFLRFSGAPILLPYGELVLAAALLVLPGGWYVVAAALAVVLFAAYLIVVARALGFAEPVHCNCFGKLGLGEIDRRTVVRNVLLLVAAVLALVDGVRGGSMIERFTDFGGTEWGWTAGVLAAIALTGMVVYGGGRPSDSAAASSAAPAVVPSDADDELEYVQQPIPYGALVDSRGGTIPLRELPHPRPALLISVSLGCGSCERVMARMPQWAARQQLIRVVLVPYGASADNTPDLGPDVEWMTDPDSAVVRTLGLGYPSAVLFGMDGMLAGGPVHGDEIDQFLDDIAAEMDEAAAAYAAQEPIG